LSVLVVAVQNYYDTCLQNTTADSTGLTSRKIDSMFLFKFEIANTFDYFVVFRQKLFLYPIKKYQIKLLLLQ